LSEVREKCTLVRKLQLQLQFQLLIITELGSEASFTVLEIFYGNLASKILQCLASAVLPWMDVFWGSRNTTHPSRYCGDSTF
jgi:hypothetical protein